MSRSCNVVRMRMRRRTWRGLQQQICVELYAVGQTRDLATGDQVNALQKRGFRRAERCCDAIRRVPQVATRLLRDTSRVTVKHGLAVLEARAMSQTDTELETWDRQTG